MNDMDLLFIFISRIPNMEFSHVVISVQNVKYLDLSPITQAFVMNTLLFQKNPEI